jgi:hypothetical protein
MGNVGGRDEIETVEGAARLKILECWRAALSNCCGGKGKGRGSKGTPYKVSHQFRHDRFEYLSDDAALWSKKKKNRALSPFIRFGLVAEAVGTAFG